MALKTSKEIRTEKRIYEIINGVEKAYESNKNVIYEFFENEGVNSLISWKIAEDARLLPYYLGLDVNSRLDVEQRSRNARIEEIENHIERINILLDVVWADEEWLGKIVIPYLKKGDHKSFRSFLEEQRDILNYERKYWLKETHAGRQKALFHALAPVFIELSMMQYKPAQQRKIVHNLLLKFKFEWKPGDRASKKTEKRDLRRIKEEFQEKLSDLLEDKAKKKPIKYRTKEEEFYMKYFDDLYTGRPHWIDSWWGDTLP